MAIGTVDGGKDQRAVLDRAADRADLVHGPAESHGAGAGHEPEARPQSSGPAARRRAGDGPECLRADGEADAAGGSGRRGARARTARPLLRIPGVAGAGAEPEISLGQRAERGLGDQDRASLIESLDDGGVVVEVLRFEAAGAPCGGIALDREQVLASPRNSVQRSPVVAGGDLGVGLSSLFERPLLRERNDEVQSWIEALEAREVHLRELERVDLPCLHQLRQLPHTGKSEGVGAASEASGDLAGERVKVRRGADGERSPDGVKSGAAGHGIENEGGSDAIGKVEIANGRERFALTGQALKHHPLLVVRDADTGDGRSRIDHLRRDLGEL